MSDFTNLGMRAWKSASCAGGVHELGAASRISAEHARGRSSSNKAALLPPSSVRTFHSTWSELLNELLCCYFYNWKRPSMRPGTPLGHPPLSMFSLPPRRSVVLSHLQLVDLMLSQKATRESVPARVEPVKLTWKRSRSAPRSAELPDLTAGSETWR